MSSPPKPVRVPIHGKPYELIHVTMDDDNHIWREIFGESDFELFAPKIVSLPGFICFEKISDELFEHLEQGSSDDKTATYLSSRDSLTDEFARVMFNVID